jgi:hypothetical protein
MREMAVNSEVIGSSRGIRGRSCRAVVVAVDGSRSSHSAVGWAAGEAASLGLDCGW